MDGARRRVVHRLAVAADRARAGWLAARRGGRADSDRCSLGVSPTVTVAVIAESRARGPLVDLATDGRRHDRAARHPRLFVDRPRGRARRVRPGAGRRAARWRSPRAWTMLGSLAFGATAGRALRAVRPLRRPRDDASCCSRSARSSPASGRRLDFEPLLAGVAAGLSSRTCCATARRRAARRDAATARCRCSCCSSRPSARRCTSRRWRRRRRRVGVAGLRALLLRRGGVAAGGARWAHLARVAAGLAGVAADVRHHARLRGGRRGRAPGLGRAAPDADGRGRRDARAHRPDHRSAPRSPKLDEIGGPPAGWSWSPIASRGFTSTRRTDRSPARATPGGVSVALDALMRERGGVWIAHGAGSADRGVVDERGSIDVPPDAPAYRLRRLWLTRRGGGAVTTPASANSALWPLCHQAHVQPAVQGGGLGGLSGGEPAVRGRRGGRGAAGRVRVPERLPPGAGRQVPARAPADPSHGALLAHSVARRRSAAHLSLAQGDRSKACSTNDLVAFQLPRDQRNFLAAVTADVGASVSGEVVYFGERPVRVVAIPIGADFDRITGILTTQELTETMTRLARRVSARGQGGRHRRRSARLHEGHPRTDRGDRSGARRAGLGSPNASCSCRLACRLARTCPPTPRFQPRSRNRSRA